MKLAVILHSFYPELRPELDACLANLDEPYDLFVTDAGSENRGYDIWPFLKVLDGLDLGAYTHVLKLHTKRDVLRPVGLNGMRVQGATWREWLLSIVSTRDAWAETKSRILGDRTVGMVAAAECILGRSSTDGKEERRMYDAAILEAARRFAISPRSLRRANYVGGTMFLARAEALRPLQGRFSSVDFGAADNAHISNSFAHLAERMIGFAVSASGFRIECPAGNLRSRRLVFHRRQFVNAVKRFFFQDRVTSRNRRLVKICRIPVWNRKI